MEFDSEVSRKKNRGFADQVCRDEQTGKVVEQDLFLSFYHKHRGSPVLVVFWETWLAEEGNILKTLQPLKEALEQHGMKVISVASENSPQAEWKRLVNGEFAGRHIRVSRDQMRYLTNEYFIGNLPVFFLVDNEGIVTRRFTDVLYVRELLNIPVK